MYPKGPAPVPNNHILPKPILQLRVSKPRVSKHWAYGPASQSRGVQGVTFMLGTAPPRSSWIMIILWVYIALNRTPNIDCYWGGGTVPKLYVSELTFGSRSRINSTVCNIRRVLLSCQEFFRRSNLLRYMSRLYLFTVISAMFANSVL